MRELWLRLGAGSMWGPSLCALGVFFLAIGAGAHGWLAKPTILRRSEGDGANLAPSVWERASLHLIIYPLWAIGFGVIVWRGVPPGMIDVRFDWEKRWPVFQPAEWVYLSIYLVPFAVPWLARSRGALRRYALDLWWLLLICTACFVLLPFGAPPRNFTPDPDSLAGNMLAWETTRSDFAAAALPSFHVCWALLCARFFATLGRGWSLAGRVWAAAVAMSCVATGAHAITDVAASFVIYPLVVSELSPLHFLLCAVEAKCFKPPLTFVRSTAEPR